MKKPDDPLEYPPHYPPTDRWKKFFLGVRSLGPDLAFFKELKDQQSQRTSDCYRYWKNDRELKVAQVLGEAFRKYMHWPTPYFLPNDHLMTIAGGPRFDWPDNLDMETALGQVGRTLGVDISDNSWEITKVSTLGELVENIVNKQGMA